ncbi:hypothetical protein L5515_012716 [Caenorhabditis briggsae]|uniref:Uncharacterized protein n=1 Tax=Caenorhabditis briggsae TaxID=6238 RepID=A0AAE9JGU6_CAEBR|nr:hypothetical protein L5515_012716 [Caenorhabditis briggsae]
MKKTSENFPVQQKDPVKYPTDYPGYVQFCDNFDDKRRRADTLAELEELLSSYCMRTKGPGRLAEILGILEALQMKQPRFEITETFVSQFGGEMANGFY